MGPYEEGSLNIVTLMLTGRATPYLHNGVVYVGDEDHYVSIAESTTVNTSDTASFGIITICEPPTKCRWPEVRVYNSMEPHCICSVEDSLGIPFKFFAFNFACKAVTCMQSANLRSTLYNSITLFCAVTLLSCVL